MIASAVPSLFWMSLLGIPIGFPAALATASIYALDRRARHYGTIAMIGGAASAVWGLLFAAMLSRGSFGISAAWVVGFFLMSGLVAAIVCHRFAKDWAGLP